jgi:DNA helicase IV
MGMGMTEKVSKSEKASQSDSRLVELEREQAYVSMLYGWLDRSRARARARLERAQRLDGGATPQARVDKDAVVAKNASRLVQLSTVEHGLCLGRLDHRDGSRLYVGRLGLFDDGHEPLLIDWRAPAAEPFYRATPAAPGEVVRRRHLNTHGRLVTGFHDDVLDLAALDDDECRGLGGDAALLASLTAPRTGRMSDIVATIQAEQDRVIRSGLPGILVIEGGAGTGKTAVALQRAAYLLYTHRDRLARRGVLVVGPNPTFLRYIQQVLPSLGETDVLLSTVDQLYPGVTAGGREPVETATLKGDRRMAEVLAAAVRDRQRVPAMPLDFQVGDSGMVLRLEPETCVRARELARVSRAPHNQAWDVFVREIVGALRESVAVLARREADRVEEEFRVVDELIDDSVFGEDEQLSEGPLLTEEQLEDLRGEIWSAVAPSVLAALDRLWPRLTPQQLVTELFSSPDRLAVAAAGLSEAERSLLVRAPLPGQAADRAGWAADRAGWAADSAAWAPDGAGWWTWADVPLLDEAAELLGEDERATRKAEARRAASARRDRAYARGVLDIVGVNAGVVDPELLAGRYRQGDLSAPLAERARQDRGWRFGHVIVDEAQDLSAMAWRMIMRRCPSRSMTIVGDLAQTGAPWGATSWARALDPHAPGRWRQERLTVNYRTPAEIMAVAADVLAGVAPHLAPPASVRETGNQPWHLRVGQADLPARLAGLAAAEAREIAGGRLAVLVPAGQARALGEYLAAALPGAVVAHGPDALDAAVAVLTVTEAKGLEFDAVIVVEPASILAESPNGANNLYVALTRATQRLGVVHAADLPPTLSRLQPRGGTELVS